jgi:hypothetical protein
MKRMLLDNIWWKLLSLGLAVLLWFVVVGAPDFFVGTLPAKIRSILGG